MLNKCLIIGIVILALIGSARTDINDDGEKNFHPQDFIDALSINDTATLSGRDDTKMYHINVPEHSTIHTTLDIPSGADFDFYAKLGSELITSDYDFRGYRSGPEDDTQTFVPGGMYYFMVRSFRGSGEYTFTATVSPPPGIEELSSGQPLQSSLSGRNDKDTYYIDLPSGYSNTRVQVSYDGSQDFDFYAKRGEISDERDYDFRGYRSGGENVARYNLRSGTWYIVVDS